MLLAGEPATPSLSPQKLHSDLEKITVEMPEVADNGGSTILAYDLEVDDGLQSDFTSVYQGLNRTVDV